MQEPVIEEQALPDHSVVAHEITVIRCEHDNRAFGQAAALESSREAFDWLFDAPLDLGVVVSDRLGQTLAVEGGEAHPEGEAVEPS